MLKEWKQQYSKKFNYKKLIILRQLKKLQKILSKEGNLQDIKSIKVFRKCRSNKFQFDINSM